MRLRNIANLDEVRAKIWDREFSEFIAIFPEFKNARTKGKNLIMICPFHTEKTPSLQLYPERNTFQCYSCSEGGGMINYYALRHEISWFEAVVRMAKIFKIKLVWKNRNITGEEAELHKMFHYPKAKRKK